MYCWLLLQICLCYLWLLFLLKGHIYIFNICFIDSVILIIKLYATYMRNINEQFVEFLWIAIQYISLIPIQHPTCEKKWKSSLIMW